MYNYAKYLDNLRIPLYFPEVLLYDINQFVIILLNSESL